jgi:hypothetical protein
MLHKMMDHLRPENFLKWPHRGRVIDNEMDKDEKKLGRLKVQVLGIMEGSKEELPWCYPWVPFHLGGKPDCSGLSVPEKDSEVWVIFPFNDPHCPFYVAFTQNELTKTPEIFDDQYPNIYGWVDSVIQWLRVSKDTEEDPKNWIEFFRSTLKDWVHLDKDGNLKINIPKNVLIEIGGRVEVDIKKRLLVDVEQVIQVKTADAAHISAKKSVTVKTDEAFEVKAKSSTFETDQPVVFTSGIKPPDNEGADGESQHKHAAGGTASAVQSAESQLDSSINVLEEQIEEMEKTLEELKKKAEKIKEATDNNKEKLGDMKQ